MRVSGDFLAHVQACASTLHCDFRHSRRSYRPGRARHVFGFPVL